MKCKRAVQSYKARLGNRNGVPMETYCASVFMYKKLGGQHYINLTRLLGRVTILINLNHLEKYSIEVTQ